MKNKSFAILALALPISIAIISSCTKEGLHEVVGNNTPEAVSAIPSKVIATYSNPLNPKDYFGLQHNEIVSQLLNLNYSGLTTEQKEAKVKANTPSFAKQYYPNSQNINLDVLNNVPGFQGNVSDINFKKNYRNILNASGLSLDAAGLLSDFIDEARSKMNSNNKDENMSILVSIENKYILKVQASALSQDNKDDLYIGMAVLRYSLGVHTDPTPAGVPKWLIGLADAVGAVIGELAGGGPLSPIGALEGAAAASGIVALY